MACNLAPPGLYLPLDPFRKDAATSGVRFLSSTFPKRNVAATSDLHLHRKRWQKCNGRDLHGSPVF